jgi:hypothetical protein
VNLAKGDFAFAVAARIPALVEEFERDLLARQEMDGRRGCWRS